MDNLDELQSITGNFIVAAAKEYVPAMYNFGELQMNLDELQRIIVSLSNLGELQRIIGIKAFVMAVKDYE